MTGPTPRVVDGDPSPLPLLLKAAVPLIPGLGLVPGLGKPPAADATLPEVALTRHDVAVDAEHLRRYAQVCGFPRKDTLPLTYPHVLAFPLQLAIMTDGAFPFPAIGTVHLENAISQHRPILVSEPLQLTVRPDALRAHPKGRLFDLVTTVHTRGELVWEETSTMLRRTAGDPDASPGTTYAPSSAHPPFPAGTTEWRLASDLGRRYAAVSGDHNPIHLYPLTAKAFGFPRQIAHGMWTKARSVAAIENRLPDAVRVEVAFRKPVVLPGTIAFGTETTPEGRAFALTRPKDGAAHLVGRASPL
jgi:acyl dehydratase